VRRRVIAKTFGVMRLLRKGVGFVVGVAGLAAAAAGIVVFSSADAIQETLSHSREIQRAFTSAVRFVEVWQKAEGRLPSASEFVTSRSQQADETYGVQHIELSTRDFPSEVTARFGSPPEGGYLLTFWRGEWNEYYASWADRSSLSFDPAAYFFFGSKRRDLFAFGTAAITLGLAALAIWPRRTSASSRPA
jgi:hypothetical protein